MIVKTLAISHVAFLSIINDVYSARFTPPVTIFELVTTSYLWIRYGASTNIRVLYLPGHCMMAVKLVPFHPIAIGILFNHYLELKDIERTIAEWKKPSQIPPKQTL